VLAVLPVLLQPSSSDFVCTVLLFHCRHNPRTDCAAVSEDVAGSVLVSFR